MTNQKGSAHVIIIVGLVVLLFGSLGFIFWQNFINKEDSTAKINTNTVAPVNDQAKVDAKLPDMITYDPTVQIVKPEDVNALKNAPDSLKAFFVDAIAKDNETYYPEPQDECFTMYSVHKIYKQKYASGGAGAGGECVGGAAILWGVVDGSWKEISGTQNTGFACEALRKHKVPSEIAGTKCIDPYSEEVEQAYSQE